MIPWINMGECNTRVDLKRIEEHYAEASGGIVRYVGDLAVTNLLGRCDADQFPIFWQQKPTQEDHSNYFGIKYSRFTQGLAIFDGRTVAEGYWYGLMHPKTGEVIFSRANWDYRLTQDGSIGIDGGRDNMRTKGNGIPVRMKVVDYRMVITDIGEWPQD